MDKSQQSKLSGSSLSEVKDYSGEGSVGMASTLALA